MSASVRRAEYGDIDAIVSMAAQFYATTSYRGFAFFCPDTVRSLAHALIDTGVMLVAEHDGRCIGMAGMFVAPFMFNRSVRTAHEVVWWVDPEHRESGAGLKLLRAIEEHCRDAGCAAIQMVHLSNSPPQAARAYERAGYAHTESCYTKEVQAWPQ